MPAGCTPHATFINYLAGFERRADGGKVGARERFRDRLTMTGDPIPYVAIVDKRRHSGYT